MWYEHEYMVFVFGENINENTGIAARYIMLYGFRDPSAKGGFNVERREVLPFSYFAETRDFLSLSGYKFFPSGAEDPENLMGVFI